MSKESARQFVKRMQDDKGFAGEVEKLDNKVERATFIKKEGFEFTKEELTTVAAELNAVDVAGGKCCGIRCESDCGTTDLIQ